MKSVAVAVLAFATFALAQPDGPMPHLNIDPKDTSNRVLVGKQFPYSQLPFKIDTVVGGERGDQTGYNICNSTTAGPDSLCQTLIVNDIKDFCVWGPPKRGTVGDTEGDNVAWCMLPKNGARQIPPGALKSVQFMRTPSYVSVTGFIDQTMINIVEGDEGGELDSGGQDQRGNPLGGAAYSYSLPSSYGTLTQSRMWHAFMGSNTFCMKLCDEKAPNASGLCRHVHDTLGCHVNIPSSYEDNANKFLSCEGDDQDPVTPGNSRIPASSKCVEFKSTDLWPAAAPTGSQSVSATVTGSVPAPTGSKPAPSGSLSPSTTSRASSTTSTQRPTITLGSGQASVTPPPGAAVSKSASMGLVAAVALAAGALFA